MAHTGPKLRVGFVLMPKFTLTAFSTFVDVLRLAADEGDLSRPIACAWEVMSPQRRPVRSSCGIDIQPSSDFVDPKTFDYLVIVGGLLHGAPGIPPEIARYLRNAAQAGVTLVGVCTGSFVLCRLGLMTDRKCCVSWYHYRDFLEEFSDLVPIADRLYVIDRDRITCSGGAGVADLAARLVSDRLGQAQAYKALHILLVERPRSGDTAQPAPSLAATKDDHLVSRALLLMEQNLMEPLAIHDLAEALSLSVRQLERHFRNHLGESPQESYMALRLKHARWMLEHSGLPAVLIAAELGFSDSSHFGRSFKARYGMTPAQFRRGRRDGDVKPESRPSPGAYDGDNVDRRVFDQDFVSGA
ncbi:GlxA family transcriptional regulator [Microvirga sp. VF16]|uniref:GlxA family transcriptional regulator n=1 Tax=Microvirga sp. VF16 TaxID=2807101 RepID=UPI001FEFFABA|nr:GlxA family transcriptional regulator [Microvirga sp. VF16]